jgi:hypothetical protein
MICKSIIANVTYFIRILVIINFQNFAQRKDVGEVFAKRKFAEAKRENPSPNERFASAEHRIFAKQKAERSAYIQLDAVFSLWHED